MTSSRAMRALSMPGTREAQAHGCPCPPVDRAGWNHEYGEFPTVTVDALCAVHGLAAIMEDM